MCAAWLEDLFATDPENLALALTRATQGHPHHTAGGGLLNQGYSGANTSYSWGVLNQGLLRGTYINQ